MFHLRRQAAEYRAWMGEVNPEVSRTLTTGRYGKQVCTMLGVSEAQLCASSAGSSLSSSTGIMRSRLGGPSHYKIDFPRLEVRGFVSFFLFNFALLTFTSAVRRTCARSGCTTCTWNSD